MGGELWMKASGGPKSLPPAGILLPAFESGFRVFAIHFVDGTQSSAIRIGSEGSRVTCAGAGGWKRETYLIVCVSPDGRSVMAVVGEAGVGVFTQPRPEADTRESAQHMTASAR